MPSQTIKIEDYIASYPDFPKKGILFRDIAPLLASPEAMTAVVDIFYEKLSPFSPDGFIGIESRGFLFSTVLARRFDMGSYILRKPGKLPGELITESYDLEYGSSALTAQANLDLNGKRIILVDDLLATGGTVKAAAALTKRLGGDPVALAAVIHLTALPGAGVIDMPLISLVDY
jgi:adenine phosphoribosyltransferase